MFKINSRYIKYIRPVVAIVILMLGAVFMLIPFIPLGYLFIAVGLLLLVPYVPFLHQLLAKIKRKDKKNRIAKAEDMLEKTENRIYDKVTDRKQNEEFRNEKDQPSG